MDEVIEIQLTQGKVALINNEDKDLAMHKWYADNSRGIWYARRWETKNKNIKTTQRKRLHMHVVVLERILKRKLMKGEQVDHINHNGIDNRRNNIRISSPSLNCVNRIRSSSNHKTSKYRGVHWAKESNKWKTQIEAKGKKIWIGNFDDELTAAKEYDKYATKLFGYYAITNFKQVKNDE